MRRFGVEATEEMESFEQDCVFGIGYVRRGLFCERAPRMP